MVIMRVVGLSLDNTAKTPIVLLQAMKEDMALPIWIGAMEAMSISLALSEQSISRPLTHDLLLHVIDNLNARLFAVEIHDFIDGIFYADLIVHKGEEIIRIDCRPSDAIALAIKIPVPIAVHREVLQKAESANQRQDTVNFQPFPESKPSFTEETKHVSLVREEEEPKKELEEKPQVPKFTKHITIQKPARKNVHIVTNTMENKEEKELIKLLHSLEPASSRKM